MNIIYAQYLQLVVEMVLRLGEHGLLLAVIQLRGLDHPDPGLGDAQHLQTVIRMQKPLPECRRLDTFVVPLGDVDPHSHNVHARGRRTGSCNGH